MAMKRAHSTTSAGGELMLFARVLNNVKHSPLVRYQQARRLRPTMSRHALFRVSK
jgi:hypothetical protein